MNNQNFSDSHSQHEEVKKQEESSFMSSSSYQSSSDKQDKKEEPPKSRFRKTHYCGYQNERLNNVSSIMDSVNDHHELSSLGLNENLLHKVAFKGSSSNVEWFSAADISQVGTPKGQQDFDELTF
jgi:hypothetical protein